MIYCKTVPSFNFERGSRKSGLHLPSLSSAFRDLQADTSSSCSPSRIQPRNSSASSCLPWGGGEGGREKREGGEKRGREERRERGREEREEGGSGERVRGKEKGEICKVKGHHNHKPNSSLTLYERLDLMACNISYT